MENQHKKRLLDDLLGKKHLSDLLAAFDDSDIAKMRNVHEEEPGWRTSLYLPMMTEKFADIKGISEKSLYSLANLLEYINSLNISSTIINDIGYPGFQGYKNTLDFVDNFFEKVNLEGKCCLLLLISSLWSAISGTCERIRCGIEYDENFGYLDDLQSEFCYMYNLKFLEILLLMD